jgi:glycolate oxidase FAD binding subunit
MRVGSGRGWWVELLKSTAHGAQGEGVRTGSPTPSGVEGAIVHAPHAVGELAEVIAGATAPLRLVGHGTWLHGRGPFVSDTLVSLAGIRGIVHYEPGDLVVTARAGTSLEELAHATRAHGQMLALAPYGSPRSTIGAVIATAAAGPLTLGDLTVRDLVLGVTTVTGSGDVVQAGGRVVKNVAGFDLVRLHTGAWGTLGAITEVSVRLHAIPEVDAIMVGTLEQELVRALPALVANRAPLPMQLVCTPGRPPELWARVSGNRARANALTTRLGALGVTALSHVESAAPLRHTPADAIVLRIRAALSDAVPVIVSARDHFADATLHYDVARGSLRVIMPTRSSDVLHATISRFLHAAAHDASHDTSHRITHGPSHTRAQHPVSVIVEQGRTVSPEPSALDAGIKRALDPRRILNRTI